MIGVSGTGNFTQNCGTNAIVGNSGLAGGDGSGIPYNSQYGAFLLGWYRGRQATPAGFMGYGLGTYTLNGGLITGGPSGTGLGGMECIGVSGSGIFNQNGGTNQCSISLFVGGTQQWGLLNGSAPNDPGYGEYHLNAGLVTVPIGTAIGGLMTVGAAGTGIFTQTGGTAIFGQITLGGQTSERKDVPDGYRQTDPSRLPGPITSRVGCCRRRASLLASGAITALPPSISPAERSRLTRFME